MKKWPLIGVGAVQWGISAYTFYFHFRRAVPWGAWYGPLLWLAMPVLTTFAAFCAYKADMMQARRQQAGLCDHCGYDLRATPERCPECGEVPRT